MPFMLRYNKPLFHCLNDIHSDKQLNSKTEAVSSSLKHFMQVHCSNFTIKICLVIVFVKPLQQNFKTKYFILLE